MTLTVRPISLAAANRYVAEHHRHSTTTRGWKFGLSVENDAGIIVGVGIAGRPVARGFDPTRVVEILRVCTDSTPNACSLIYGRLCRAAKALGYELAITYTLKCEGGSSLRAAGFRAVAEVSDRSWSSEKRVRQEETLFGPRRHREIRIRWERQLLGKG